MKRVLYPTKDTVTYLSGQGNYTYCHLQDGKKLLISRTLSGCLEYYPDFIRIHRTYAVNPAFLDDSRRLSANTGEVHLAGLWLPVGRRRLSVVFRHVKQLTASVNK